MINIETQETTRSQDQPSIFARIWIWIINPHPTITEIGDRRRAQLLAGISLILVIPLLLGAISRVFTNCKKI